MPFDRQAVLHRIGGDEVLLRDIAALFLKDSPGMLAQMRQALDAGNAKNLGKMAHMIKGSASNFGADDAVAIALHIEEMARKGDLDGARRACMALEQAVQALNATLSQL